MAYSLTVIVQLHPVNFKHIEDNKKRNENQIPESESLILLICSKESFAVIHYKSGSSL